MTLSVTVFALMGLVFALTARHLYYHGKIK